MPGQINLGHAAFFGVGTLVTRQPGWAVGRSRWRSFAGGLAGVALALLIGLPTFRLRGVYFSVGTLALAEMLRITVSNTLPQVSALPIGQLTTYTLQPRYFLALGLATVCVAATLR